MPPLRVAWLEESQVAACSASPQLGQRLGLDVEVVDQPGHRLLLALCAVQEEPGDRLAGDERILIGHLWTKEV